MINLTEKYVTVMFDEISNVYFKSLFVEEHFNIYFYLKNLKINSLLLSFLSEKLYSSIPNKNLELLLLRNDIAGLKSKISVSINEIFDSFKEKFDVSDLYKDLPYVVNQYDCEISNINVNFFEGQKYDNQFYIEKYLRIEVNDEAVYDQIFRNSVVYKNVVNKKSFLQTLSDNSSAIYSLSGQQRLELFKSIKQGIRLVYLNKNSSIGNNLNINLLKQNDTYQKEKMWALFGRNSTINESNSIVNFPMEIAKVESYNLMDHYTDVFNALTLPEIDNETNQYLIDNLINNSDYQKFFTKIIPIELISLMNYVSFKKRSELFKDVMKENSLFINTPNSIFKLLKELINYKEFVK